VKKGTRKSEAAENGAGWLLEPAQRNRHKGKKKRKGDTRATSSLKKKNRGVMNTKSVLTPFREEDHKRDGGRQATEI